MVLWTVYIALIFFISPVWLTIIYLQLKGKAYLIDWKYDEGITWILGATSLSGWIIMALAPGIFYLLIMKKFDIKFLWIGFGIMAGAAVICCGLCGWNIVRFLTAPISVLRLSQ